jgi:hypothetical protein
LGVFLHTHLLILLLLKKIDQYISFGEKSLLFRRKSQKIVIITSTPGPGLWFSQVNICLHVFNGAVDVLGGVLKRRVSQLRHHPRQEVDLVILVPIL